MYTHIHVHTYTLCMCIHVLCTFTFTCTCRSYPKSRRDYENSAGGNSYLIATRKKELLSPVPESTSSSARVVEVSAPGSGGPQRGVMRTWGVGEGGAMTSSMGGPNTRSMENITQQGTSPMSRRRNYRETQVGMSNGRPHYRLAPPTLQ